MQLSAKALGRGVTEMKAQRRYANSPGSQSLPDCWTLKLRVLTASASLFRDPESTVRTISGSHATPLQ